jgi:hypothetical protein
MAGLLAGSVLEALGTDRARIAQVGKHAGELLGDAAEVARPAPVGGRGGLPLLVLGQALGDALEQVLGFGVPLGVASGRRLSWSIVLWCSSSRLHSSLHSAGRSKRNLLPGREKVPCPC